MSNQQQTIVQVQAYFNRLVKKRGAKYSDWETVFSEKKMLFNPTKEQIAEQLRRLAGKLSVETLYTQRGELDRKVVCDAFYPEVHDDATLAYYGAKIAETNKVNSGPEEITWFE